MLLRSASLRSRAGAVEVGATLCIPLLLGPLVHKAHMLWVLPGLVALLAGLRDRPGKVSTVLLALSLVLIGGTTPVLIGRAAASTLLSHNAIFFVASFVAPAPGFSDVPSTATPSSCTEDWTIGVEAAFATM